MVRCCALQARVTAPGRLTVRQVGLGITVVALAIALVLCGVAVMVNVVTRRPPARVRVPVEPPAPRRTNWWTNDRRRLGR